MDSGLLTDIEKFKKGKLKKSETNDRSGPVLTKEKSASNGMFPAGGPALPSAGRGRGSVPPRPNGQGRGNAPANGHAANQNPNANRGRALPPPRPGTQGGSTAATSARPAGPVGAPPPRPSNGPPPRPGPGQGGANGAGNAAPPVGASRPAVAPPTGGPPHVAGAGSGPAVAPPSRPTGPPPRPNVAAPSRPAVPTTPTRPNTTAKAGSGISAMETEGRFQFHPLSDLPDPPPFRGTQKVYPSNATTGSSPVSSTPAIAPSRPPVATGPPPPGPSRTGSSIERPPQPTGPPVARPGTGPATPAPRPSGGPPPRPSGGPPPRPSGGPPPRPSGGPPPRPGPGSSTAPRAQAQDDGAFLEDAITKVKAAMDGAMSSHEFEKCIELRSNLETLEQLKAQYDSGQDVSAEVQRLRG